MKFKQTIRIIVIAVPMYEQLDYQYSSTEVPSLNLCVVQGNNCGGQCQNFCGFSGVFQFLPGDIGEVPVTQVKQYKGCRMSCDVGEAMEGLENEL